MEADHGMRSNEIREELSIGFRSLREPQHAVVDNLRAVLPGCGEEASSTARTDVCQSGDMLLDAEATSKISQFFNFTKHVHLAAGHQPKSRSPSKLPMTP